MKNFMSQHQVIGYRKGIAFFLAYYVVFQLLYNELATRRLLPYDSTSEMLLGILLNIIPIFIIFLGNYFLVFHVVKIKRVTLKIMVDIILSFGLMTIEDFLFLFVMSGSAHSHVDWAGTVFNNVFLLMGIEMAYFAVNFKKSVIESERQHQLAMQYQYDALRSQVSPHFLFNSLNVLYSLITENTDMALDFTVSLSETYRYVLNNQQKECVRLCDELKFLKSYVNVLRKRWYGNFEVRISGADHVGNHEIIPFTMQLLIENITKHNVISDKHPMVVDIEITADGVKVSNPIRPRQCPYKHHIGLRYLGTLYQRYGKNFSYTSDNNVFSVFVPYVK